MAQVMAILQDVDKCVRCNGCVISCKRTWQMTGIVPEDQKPNQKVTKNQRVVIKPMRRVDNPPFMRYSCWHCENPPCAKRCPRKAITKDFASGRVWIDYAKCTPYATPLCNMVCQSDCGRGGYPKIGSGCDATGQTAPKAWKCTMCYGRSGSDAELNVAGTQTKWGDKLPTTARFTGTGTTGDPFVYYSSLYPAVAVSELAHMPACVYTCPAKAMTYDTRDHILAYIRAEAESGLYPALQADGDGSIYWLSRVNYLLAPKADPFMEDHVSPMVSSLLNSPFAKAALVPTLVAGGLLALASRRARIQEEESCMSGGEAR
jgi:Fe-S-cluster-containing dehydrogenase component